MYTYSSAIKYYNESGGTTHTSYESLSSRHLAGAPADFYGNDTYWVPAIDGSSNIDIVDSDGTENTFESTGNNIKNTPIAGVNWTSNETLEVVHLYSGDVAYTTEDGEPKRIKDSNGNNINAKSVGIAGVASYPGPLSVSNFEANATGDQNVTVNVTTNQTLSELNVTLSGPENATLTLGDFEQTGSNPYSYTATYDGSTDGGYEATVERAASAGDSVSSAGSDTASVDEVDPALHSVNLTDATNDDGLVSPGESVEVTANATGDVGTVTANLSAFDAGSNVTLSHESGDTYNWTGEVGPNPNDGNQTADMTVSDGQGNTVSNETGTLTVDTGELSVELNDSRTVVADESVGFSPQSVGNASGDVTYEWEFGDGASATGETVNNTYNATGEYVVNLTVSDETDDTANASTNVTVKESPAVESVNLTDVTDENGIVVPGDRVEVAANVTGEVDTVTANLSAFDAGTVELDGSGEVYNWTGEVGTNPTDGNHFATVTAAGDVGDNASEDTNALEVDTDELAVSLNDNRTVQAGVEYEYHPKSVDNETGEVTYDWAFAGTDERTGKSVNYTFNSTGTYTVELNTSDDSRDTANDSVELTPVNGDTYNRTVAVDSNATDGEQAVTVTVAGSDYMDSADTGTLTVDTDTLDVSLSDSRTVDVGEEAEYSPAAVNDAVGDVDYEWEFGSSTVETGKTVTHVFDSAATYEVVLTASDGSNDTATASMKVDVVSTATTSDSTTDDSTGGGSGGSLDSGGSTDPATESTSTEGTETSTATPTSTQTATSTQTTTEDPQTATEEATATSETTDQTPSTGTDGGTDPGTDQTPGEAPGFGAVAALLALAAAAGLALRE